MVSNFYIRDGSSRRRVNKVGHTLFLVVPETGLVSSLHESVLALHPMESSVPRWLGTSFSLGVSGLSFASPYHPCAKNIFSHWYHSKYICGVCCFFLILCGSVHLWFCWLLSKVFLSAWNFAIFLRSTVLWLCALLTGFCICLWSWADSSWSPLSDFFSSLWDHVSHQCHIQSQ